ncbi:C4b-binding protein alpha chain-like isoform X2 [Oncorhynchus keta]|uniref:C4b-binding protein alpha chain-like isoform X2 n=1 Tax=Oncorhynchus keta TaxID=8018 RepID=UPI00227AE586|nr:C4b-binding protein alpha chain-like isoform X2 [Oncorhynchus keta]
MQPSNVCWSLTIWMVQLALTVLTVQAKNCTKPIGGPNMVLSDAFITQETFVDGANVTFQCAVGYASTGRSPPVTCTAGVWSEVKLKCERKSCGSPGEVTNGQFNTSQGVLFGDQVVATCNTGYVLVGSGVRNCMDGGWDGRVPVCEVVKCGKPPNIVNGGPVVPPDDTYDYGNVVPYACEKDYTLVGAKSITCSENGEFQPAPPECKMVSCPNPVVENGVRIDGRPLYVHVFVTYRCNAGYEMEGQASLTCEIEGWSAPYPTCKAKNCTKPIGGENMVLSDAFITQETFVDGANVTFQCAIGYASTGCSPTVTCTAGVWSEVKLKCKRKSCGSPGEVTNGQFNTSQGVLFGDQVVATCNTGYVLVGSGVRTCMDGGWDGRVPVCEVVKCGKPPNIVNGGPVVPPDDTYDYGSVVPYACEKNYTLVGAKSITCSENGEFQPAPPECKMVSCPNPVVENGVRIDGRPPYTYMSLVTYRCNAGYEMEGQASLTCEIEGWSAPYPTCKAKNCTKPIGGPNMVLSDAFITQETFVDGAKVTFQCAIGYASTGRSPPVTCTAGVWSEVKLKCERKSCGSPGEVMNGQFNISEGVLFGDQVVATCNTGYVLVGSGVRTCMDGGWDGRVPVCEVVKCGKPPNIVNGGPVVPPDDTYDYGSVVQYACEKDYTLVGAKSITCSENGEFQPAPPECKMVSCPNPVVENGVRIDGRPPYTYMSFVTYRCNTGYEMEGQASLTCEIEGWSAPYPTCKALLTTTKPPTTKKTTIQDRVPRPTDLTPKANDNTGLIAGCVVGGLAIICGAVFAVYKVKRSAK